MLREKFLNTIDEFENCKFTITIYHNDEIISRFKIKEASIEEYDDEIVIYGEQNDFIILNCQDINIETGENNEIEFLFSTGDHRIGVEFIK